ncbi:DUF4756 family protein, partial [Escherichia coli]|nr:DUF4756 family protein [Escherichia coli]
MHHFIYEVFFMRKVKTDNSDLIEYLDTV